MSSSICLRHLSRFSTTIIVAAGVNKTKHCSSPSSRYAQDLTVRRLAKSRRFSEIESLIESHKTDPKISQEPFLSTLIRSYGIAGIQSRQFYKVPQLFDEIPKKYEGVSPDKVSYGILIKAYCEAEEAEVLWFEMTKTGCELDVAAFNLFKRGMLDDAKKVYEGLKSNGCNPNAATIRNMVFYLCLNGLHEQGYKVFKESVRLNKVPDFNTLKHLAEGLVMKKKTKDAKGLIRTVKETFPPNFMNAWTKLEKELGLSSCGAGNAEAQEAKESTG
ncbi:Splicing factor U2af large subunit A isoform 1 [Hibiscus syriacus]|uniref:Splicing factor U2af large subunit A isoform 1 n=1 Tax=Hibiscus syriacus TaxID=106335 RepID=A0A6A2ZXA0_HIBSY|nr:Splicing factor U2af large subunit A isoform 1 [Hibiscus syriacus]